YLQIVFPKSGVQAVVATTSISSSSYTGVAGTWTWDGTNTIMRIYVNGIEDASPLSVPDRLSLSSAVALRIGGSGGHPIGGVVDEVRAFSHALSDQEVTTLFLEWTPDQGPILRYDMENLTADGRMQDFSGFGNHGTITGTTDVVGKIGRARQFDGAGNGIKTTTAPHRLSSGSFALWVLPDSVQTPPAAGLYPNIIGWTWDPGLYIQAATGKPYLQLIFPNAGVQAVVASTPLSSSAYHHLTGTWDWDGANTVMRIYFDGVEDARAVVVPDALPRQARLVQVGSSAVSLKGIADEVLVYDRALTAQEIGSLATKSTDALSQSKEVLDPGVTSPGKAGPGLDANPGPPESIVLQSLGISLLSRDCVFLFAPSPSWSR